jgi:hypothetical protein
MARCFVVGRRRRRRALVVGRKNKDTKLAFSSPPQATT